MSYYSDMIKKANDIAMSNGLSDADMEAIYRKVHFDYMVEDCRRHLEEDIDWEDITLSYGVDCEEIYDSDKAINDIVEIYVYKTFDCNRAENDNWYEAIMYYIQDHKK